MSTDPIAQPGDPAWMHRYEARVNGRLLPPVIDGLTIAAFISVWFIPFAGLILGHFANRAAKREGRRRSALAIAAVVLGYLGAIAWLFIIIHLGYALAGAATAVPAA
jgi:hypothetical protein